MNKQKARELNDIKKAGEEVNNYIQIGIDTERKRILRIMKKYRMNGIGFDYYGFKEEIEKE
jgi:hypothetical protein